MLPGDLRDSIRRGDQSRISALIASNPELATTEIDHLYPLHHAVLARRPEIVQLLISLGANPDAGLYPFRGTTSPLTVAKERGLIEIVAAIESAPRPARHSRPDEPGPANNLWNCAGTGDYAAATALLEGGANPNEIVYASGSPMFRAFSQGDEGMIALLSQYGGLPEATIPGLFRLTDLARHMLAGEVAYRLDGAGGETLAEQLLWGAACGGDPEIVRMSLERVDWPRDDLRWFTILEQPLRVWRYGSVSKDWNHSRYPVCFGLVLARCDPNMMGRFGLTMLHAVAGSRDHVAPEERVQFATLLLDAGAKVDVRDRLLDKTPFEWARERRREELEALFVNRRA